MPTTERERATGGSGEQPSHFDCTYCEASVRSTAVEYGPFGYPRCPVCRMEYGPRTRTES